MAFHNSNIRQLKLAKMELEVCNQADALIAVTEDDAAVLRKEIGSEKPIWVIPNIHPLDEITSRFRCAKWFTFYW